MRITGCLPWIYPEWVKTRLGICNDGYHYKCPIVYLTHWRRVTHIWVSKLYILWFRKWLVACWNIVNWTLRNKLQWNFNRNSYIFIIQENALKMSSVKWRSFCLFNPLKHSLSDIKVTSQGRHGARLIQQFVQAKGKTWKVRVTITLWGKFTGNQWILRPGAKNAERRPMF